MDHRALEGATAAVPIAPAAVAEIGSAGSSPADSSTGTGGDER